MEHLHDHDHDHRREQIAEIVKTGLLIGLGLYFVVNIISGNLTNYINVRFSWLSYVAAVLFLLIGAFSALGLLNARRAEHDHHHDHDHDHSAISWGTLIVVAVPLVLGTLIPSRPLGAESVDGNVSITASSVDNMVLSIEPSKRNVLDWLRVFNATDDYATLSGQPADVIGFVYLEPTFGENQFMVARFTVSCCVADASAIGIPVQWPEAVEQGQWVRVTGVMETGDFRGDAAPILHAQAVEVVEQPEHPYLYP
ncbi:MAG: TIGR03943 family protein [Chloroflexi bacterium]|uniref:TIGR03943 family putative permease subunit n=1 Tax=Candidatus Flexifilum breve TaxID=3140694 RepID=UPI00313764D8|nr:TIGR03943 family protein [Chloroflexota bacterium]